MRPILTVLLLILLTSCHQTEQKIHGYVEGEFVMIAPTSSGLLQSLQVKRGQTVIRGQKLFALDLTELTAQRDSAVASVQLAQANLNDLLKGQRPQELNIILEQKQQALANYANAEKEYQRNIPLATAKAISQLELDNTKFAYINAKARIAELEAQITAAKLGARIDKVEAANASIEIAKENLAQIEKKIVDASPTSPADGVIQDTYFQPGEYINTGQAVVNLLPPQNVKIRFFLAQKDIAQIKPNQVISFSCDGCKQSIPAKITYISSNAEYTPPVIYSVESRDKLVFMLEATPDTFHLELKPGLPVDIEVNH